MKISKDLEKTQTVFQIIWACKDSKRQYYERYYYNNDWKIYFPLNVYHFNFEIKVIEKSHSIITELKLCCFIAEIF